MTAFVTNFVKNARSSKQKWDVHRCVSNSTPGRTSLLVVIQDVIWIVNFTRTYPTIIWYRIIIILQFMNDICGLGFYSNRVQHPFTVLLIRSRKYSQTASQNRNFRNFECDKMIFKDQKWENVELKWNL